MDRFLKACGLDAPARIEVQGGTRRQRALPHAYALIGRSAASDLRLNHPQLSLRHAYLQVVAGRLACFDLGGRSGIQWDDGRPARSGWLDPGRSIGLGPFTIRRTDPAPPRPEPVADTSPLNTDWAFAGPETILEFPDEAGGPVRWNVRRAVTLVGRAPSCRVRLPDESVSWFHCSLVRTLEGLWVVDLLSRDGLSINDVPQRCARLEDGDELRIGRFRVVPRYSGAARRPVGGPWTVTTQVGPATPRLDLVLPRPSATPALPAPADAPAFPPLAPIDVPLEPEIVDLIAAHRNDQNSPALVALVEKFGQMQQQMLEQFHQTMMMMIQHMSEHHREQVRQVREEVDRLRQLSEELVELKAQLESGPPAPPPTPPAAAPLPPPTRRAPNGQPPTPAGPEATPRPVATPPPERTASGEDPLVMVTRRIAQIRSEQRSRWQKILDLVRTR
jgi:pSer/pThr/pTyr-binding forkhead associated (FHA) protein